MSKMFKTDERKIGVPLALLPLPEQVRRKRDIGIDTDTPQDYLCRSCLVMGSFSTLFELDDGLRCPIHALDCAPRHKAFVYEYEDQYIEELKYRLQEETVTDKALVVRSHSPLIPSSEDKRRLMSDYIKAGLVTSTDFGAARDMAAEYLAIVALVHGLDPTLKEVSVWPVRRKVDGNWKVVGIETHIGVYGYQRQADDRARTGDDYSWGETTVLTTQEKIERLAHKCPKCSGTGKTGNYNCDRCKGKGEFEPDEVIAVRREIYLRRQAKMAQEIGIPVTPVVGYGVYRPGDSIPEGRDGMWRAESRASKDAFKKAYALDFWLPSTELLESRVDSGEELVVVSEDANGDTIEVEAVEVSAEEPLVEEEQPEMPGLDQLGFKEILPVDVKGHTMDRLEELGYPKVSHMGLIHALYGEEVNWANLTAGQAFNMLAYAARAAQFDDTKASKESKDALKDVAREKTASLEFWLDG